MKYSLLACLVEIFGNWGKFPFFMAESMLGGVFFSILKEQNLILIDSFCWHCALFCLRPAQPA